MEGNKCFGLLLALFITLGLSFAASSGVSALKYPIDSIDFSNPTYEFRKVHLLDGEFPIIFERNHDFYVGFAPSLTVPSNFQYPRTWRFVGNYNSSTNSCELYQYSDGVYLTNYASGYQLLRQSLSFTGYNYHNLIPDDSPFDLSQPLSYGNNSWLTTFGYSGRPLCHMPDFSYYFTETPPPAYENYPIWNFSSLVNIPLVNNRFKYEDSQPYTYQYNKLYLRGNQKVDGVVIESNGLSTEDIFGTSIPDVSNYTMDFSLFDSAVNRLDYEGSPETNIQNFTFGGSILFDSDYTFDSDCTYNSTCILLAVTNYNLDSRLSSSDILSTSSDFTLPDGSSLYTLYSSHLYNESNCTVSQYHISNGDSDNRLDFQCHYDPSSLNNPYLSNLIDFRNLNVRLMFGSSLGYDSGSLIHTDADYKFQDFYVVTNDNWTPTDWTATDTGSGGNVFDSPGYGVPSDGGEVNWFDSLTSMFNFSLVNPFAPLFNLFNSGSDCIQIPTIAGMIHSEETQVCPWFNSSVRNIVTPVLGISSMMLVFGFAVRWLGASSGNMFEDSGSVVPPADYPAGSAGVKHVGWRRRK